MLWRKSKLPLWFFFAFGFWSFISIWFKIWPVGSVYDGQSLANCRGNLKAINTAKRSLQEKYGWTNGYAISAEVISNYFHGNLPSCPAGGIYDVGALAKIPSVPLREHPSPFREYHHLIFWKWKIPPAAPHAYSFQGR